MYKAIIFIFFLFRISVCTASAITNSAAVEQKITELYLNKSWADLVKYGNQAIHEGYDYFYLRMRIGIAYYSQKKYMKAVAHFEKAVKFNSDDKTALEYLYYSYVFSGRSSEARALTLMFSLELNESIKPAENKYIQSVNVEGGIALSSLNDNFANIDIDGSANIYGEAVITKNMQYLNAGLNHELGRRLSVYQAYSNIQINLTKDIKRNNKDTSDNYLLTQHDYYVSPSIQFKGFSVSPAFHLINVNFGQMSASYDKLHYKYIFTKKDTSFINYAASFSIAKNIGIYIYNFTGGYSQLNGLTQLQTGLSLTYFPLTNLNFYGTSSLVYLNENSTNRVIVLQKVGFKILSKLWADAGITYGNLQNYCENNAFVVYNTGDKILYKCGFSVTSPLFKHFEFSLRYDFYNRENTYYTVNDKLATESLTVNYKTHSIIGGIKWKL